MIPCPRSWRLSVLIACWPVLVSAVTTIPLVQPGDTWHYRKGVDAPQTDWKTADEADLDGSWETGPGGFGYSTSGASETANCQTLLPDMRNGYTTVYLRKQFTLTETPAPDLHLMLSMDWDDGYIAYLDGIHYLTSGVYAAAPVEPAYGDTADDNHESSTGSSTPQPPVTTDLGPAATLLGAGTHTLSIVGLNVSMTSSDFVMVPTLWMETPPVQNNVSGLIDTDTVWHATNSPYTVVGDISVAANTTLIIEPGVTVEFDPGQGMTVQGRLLADGTADQPILFTRSQPGTTWERLLFLEAGDSRLAHCTIEYADCEGDHKDYYDDDCNDATTPPSRVYFQAVVVIACHLDIDSCLFQNLPDSTGSREGDAIAIISDDPDLPGEATAHIRNCQFISIGQGVHTRYAYVLVENCYFTDHHGDNDDIDLYGESIPPPMIRYNRLISPSHDDMINPTRCSAILIGNIIANCDDHGIVLRDRCRPVLINNLIYNCSSAGIAVQNQCDALLVNNLIVNCSRGVRFFDHTGRWEAPYCLFPGSGKATLINNIIWDCTTPLLLTDSPYTGDPGSHATVQTCNIEGGQAAASVSGNSTLTWGAGNLDVNPLFLDLDGDDYHLATNSPCINSGSVVSAVLSVTNRLGETADILITVSNDVDRLGRPLDGLGDSLAVHDIGPYEFLRPSADSNGDGIPDGWYAGYGLNPADPQEGLSNPDADPARTGEEYVADTNPTNAASFLQVTHIDPHTDGVPAQVTFGPSRTNRWYTLQHNDNLPVSGWSDSTGQPARPGNGSNTDILPDTDPPGTHRHYRIKVQIP